MELKILVESSSPSSSKDEEYTDIPLDISELLEICQEYQLLGYQLQKHLHYLLDGEKIELCKIKPSFLPYLKNFLSLISKNDFFGDASLQARDLIKKIDEFLINEKKQEINNLN